MTTPRERLSPNRLGSVTGPGAVVRLAAGNPGPTLAEGGSAALLGNERAESSEGGSAALLGKESSEGADS